MRYTPLSTLIAKELETYQLLVAVYTIVTFLELSGGQNLTSLPWFGNCKLFSCSSHV